MRISEFLKTLTKKQKISLYHQLSKELGLPIIDEPKKEKPIGGGGIIFNEVNWILTSSYMKQIKKKYHPALVQSPSKKYINKKDLICSNRKSNPKGKFYAVCFVFIANYDGKRQIFINYLQYSDRSVAFNEISDWAIANGEDLMSRMINRTSLWFEKIIAYEFVKKPKKLSILPDYKGQEV